MVTNFVWARPQPKGLNFSSSQYDIHFSFLDCPIFGGHLATTHFEKNEVLHIDDENMSERILAVSRSKKAEERQMYRSYRRPSALFQYKYYKSQSRLVGAEKWIDSLLKVIIHSDENTENFDPIQSAYSDSRLTACKILIKLLMDIYCTDLELASKIVLSIVLEMLQHPAIETRLTAFNLIFNLSVHMNLYEELPFFDSDEQGITPTVQRIQDDLCDILKEMLLALIHHQETRRKIWFSGMNLLFYFITDNGHILKDRLNGLDVRIVPAFFRYIDYISDEVFRNLVRILMNLLYVECSRAHVSFVSSSPQSPSSPSSLANTVGTTTATSTTTPLGTTSLEKGTSTLPTPQHSPPSSLVGTSTHSSVSSSTNSLHTNISQSLKDAPLTSNVNITSPHIEYKLDVRKLNYACGIDFILQLYTRSRSTEANDNLFTLIFDYLVISHFRRKYIKDRKEKTIQRTLSDNEDTSQTEEIIQFQYIFELFKRLDAPQYFSQLFKYVPENFTERIMKFIVDKCAATAIGGQSGGSTNTPTTEGNILQKLIEKIDRNLLEGVIKDFQRLAERHLKLADEFDIVLKEILATKEKSTHGEITDSHISLLNELLTSSLPSDRKNGETFLFRLKKEILLRPRSFSPSFHSAVDNIFNKLMTSSSTKVRQIYLSITEKLILVLKCQMQTHGEEQTLNEMFRILNDNLTFVVNSQETNEQNLMFLFDIVFNFLKFSAVTRKVPSHSTIESHASTLGHDLYQYNELKNYSDLRELQFVSGKIWVPLSLLRRLSIIPLRDTFQRLPPRLTSLARTSLLYLIIEKCKENKQDMHAVGGSSFFKRLLADNDPQISFLASRFLLDKLQHEQPEQFNILVNTLVDKAVKANDEKLVNNPYLQIKAIFELKQMKDEDDKKK